ncbi:hypothetical protein BH10BAC6_BH10BAC6_04420 [soil metagenome]
MKIVNMHAAKTTLSQLVEDVLNGEEVFIARNGTPVVQLNAVGSKTTRPIGLHRIPHGTVTDDSCLFEYMTEDELFSSTDPLNISDETISP